MDSSPVSTAQPPALGPGRRRIRNRLNFPGGLRAKFGLAAAAGILVVVGLAVHQGLAQIREALGQAGWGLVLVCLLHLPALICSAWAWQVILRPVWSGSTWIFLRARWIREAVNTLLPVAQIGGDVVGARILTFHEMPAGLAGASVVVDLTLEVLAQFVFTLLGLALLLGSGHSPGMAHAIGLGLMMAVPLLIGFLLAQRRGLFGLLEGLLRRIAEQQPALGLGRIDGLNDAIQELYGWPRGVVAGGGLHFVSWVLTSTQVWLALQLMGHPLSLGQALVLLSLGHAARSAAFLVPSGLGVQEAGLMLLGALYGLPAGIGLAVSLALRVREIALGVPALLCWPYLEGRRFFAARQANDGSETPRA